MPAVTRARGPAPRRRDIVVVVRAVAVYPNRREVSIVEHPEPQITGPGEIKIRILEVGVCGTDRDIVTFRLGTPPPGSDYLVLGHESLGEVTEAGPEAHGLARGDLVIGMVRTPCLDPACAACRGGRQDLCLSLDYRERGIKDRHGFMTDFVVEQRQFVHRVPAELRDIAVLVEPLTIAEKALAQVRAVQTRLPGWGGQRRALVLGAGPVGLLGAMLLRSAGFETHVYSAEPRAHPRAAIAEAIGGQYFSSEKTGPDAVAQAIGNIDLVYEAAGAPQLAFDVLRMLGANGVFVFTGIPRHGKQVHFEAPEILYHMVLKNQVILGTVNAGSEAFESAIRDLADFERRWPRAVRSLITGRYPLEQFREPVLGCAGIKNVIVVDGRR